jgi:hypothetical protein
VCGVLMHVLQSRVVSRYGIGRGSNAARICDLDIEFRRWDDFNIAQVVLCFCRNTIVIHSIHAGES